MIEEDIILEEKINSKRIYHPYNKWEDYLNGFYENCSGEEKKKYISLVLEMFISESKTIEMMNFVVDNWKIFM